MATLTTHMRSDYELLFDSCLIQPARAATVNAMVSRIAANRSRYETVGKPLGIPWYVVGLIHAMESGGDFKRHLHNGDPLTARTRNWPPGRPPGGTPPFTWEDSASDALRMRKLQAWKDWSIPGVLYQLEGYNGWGYRDVKPPISTPYLWSFSNHYTRGKYVSDGKYSATAVSQQCGAGPLLKRMLEAGLLRDRAVEPRTLQLTNPYMTGPDVEEAQTLLGENAYGDFMPGNPDGEYGEVSAAATARAKVALGFPDAQVDGVF